MFPLSITMQANFVKNAKAGILLMARHRAQEQRQWQA
jgi:hypothetical protein